MFVVYSRPAKGQGIDPPSARAHHPSVFGTAAERADLPLLLQPEPAVLRPRVQVALHRRRTA